MADEFDPYYKWLAIPPDEQPPNHYRLLSLRLYEEDRDVIDGSAERQMTHVRAQATGKHGDQAQRLLNELAQAKLILLDEDKKAGYDAELRSRLGTLEKGDRASQEVPLFRRVPIPKGQTSEETPIHHDVPIPEHNIEVFPETPIDEPLEDEDADFEDIPVGTPVEETPEEIPAGELVEDVLDNVGHVASPIHTDQPHRRSVRPKELRPIPRPVPRTSATKVVAKALPVGTPVSTRATGTTARNRTSEQKQRQCWYSPMRVGIVAAAVAFVVGIISLIIVGSFFSRPNKEAVVRREKDKPGEKELATDKPSTLGNSNAKRRGDESDAGTDNTGVSALDEPTQTAIAVVPTLPKQRTVPVEPPIPDPISVDLMGEGTETAPRNDLLQEIGAYGGTGLSGRGSAARSGLVARGGGTKGSEAAVGAALKWFQAHQLPDGGWSFDHRIGACQGRCDSAGSLKEARRGATAMALLPFLGAGQTHKEGKYINTVKRGLNFLVGSMKVDRRAGVGTLEEPGGRMYSHGLGAIVLCEAYAMTHDKGLLAPAQLSLNHIAYAQDPVGGGWRYTPKQAGDTSVVGWQLMALKSGHMAYLKVNPNTIRGASKFLDAVGADSGAQYGYTGPAAGRSATTAIGLLCRMYLGWKKDHPGLQRGVDYLDRTGPSTGSPNMYYNYYATQVMRHNQGPDWEAKWKKWNPKMRDFLVNSQSKKGHSTGSWAFKGGDHGSARGGRVYSTSMATMILEVYYRHMPIYRQQAAQDDFPL